MLTLYRHLIALRRAEPALIHGTYIDFAARDCVLAYLRQHGDRRLLIALNLGHASCEFDLPSGSEKGRVLLSTHPDRTDEPIRSRFKLRGDEGIVISLEAPST